MVDGVIMEDVSNIGADDLASGNPETLISSAIAGLNADDIESFQVLKDGSATFYLWCTRYGRVSIVRDDEEGEARSGELQLHG